MSEHERDKLDVDVKLKASSFDLLQYLTYDSCKFSVSYSIILCNETVVNREIDKLKKQREKN